jgi:fatty-acyl-CoA synthase
VRVETVVSSGRAAHGIELGVFDEGGRRLSDGVVGEIGFECASRFSGYLGDPEATARALRGERVFPGDLGYLRNGELFWVGRASERIVLHGRKLDPSELERVLFASEGLRKGSFAAFGREDPERGTEVLVVLAEVDPAWVERCAEVAARVRSAAAAELGVVIEELALVPKGELAKTSSGKRRHRHFRELYLRGELAVLHVSGPAKS